MFSRIAPRYDLLNHILSLNLDKLWRKRTARHFGHILARADARALDLCCGTGDLAIALKREAGKQGGRERARIYGSDFAHPMLRLAREKSPGEQGIEYVEADALKLPFPEASFDLVTAAFGFRNLANYEAGLREIFRVLRPDGEVGILEFSEPRPRLIRPLYRFYFKHILPRVGGAISGSDAAYSYLPASVAKFPSPEELASLMTRCGFAEACYEVWTAGIVALHTGRKM